jgi:hypothetical protein
MFSMMLFIYEVGAIGKKRGNMFGLDDITEPFFHQNFGFLYTPTSRALFIIL